jgi:hypothetical protein
LEVKTMRKRACVSLLALSLIVSALAAAPAYAKSPNGLRAQVPFDFHVGDEIVPSGEYTVSALNDDGSALRIRSASGRECATTPANAKQAKLNAKSSPRLVFHKYGEQYFLAAVWGDGETGREIPESGRERALRRGRLVAGNARMEVITVAAR